MLEQRCLSWKKRLRERKADSRIAGQGWFTQEPVDKAVTYFNALSGAYTVPQGMVRAWAEEMNKKSNARVD
jgi:hypothetical protein